jgi:hypothetical protein
MRRPLPCKAKSKIESFIIERPLKRPRPQKLGSSLQIREEMKGCSEKGLQGNWLKTWKMQFLPLLKHVPDHLLKGKTSQKKIKLNMNVDLCEPRSSYIY